jgi:hypothetical protein
LGSLQLDLQLLLRLFVKLIRDLRSDRYWFFL